ncbi:hypothetical protein LUZ60_016574 [Juncus effusus]|nr:hypothetical protein LUZ60_016574 [Juncus effusus]
MARFLNRAVSLTQTLSLLYFQIFIGFPFKILKKMYIDPFLFVFQVIFGRRERKEPPPQCRAAQATPPPPPPPPPQSRSEPPQTQSRSEPPSPPPRAAGSPPPPRAAGPPPPPRAAGPPPPPPAAGPPPPQSRAGPPPPPPPPRAAGRAPPLPPKSQLKFRPFYWEIVKRAQSANHLWAQDPMRPHDSDPGFDLAELESLFSAAQSKTCLKSHSKSCPKNSKIHLIDLRRANNCSILLRNVNMPLSNLISAILALDDSVLNGDQVENLLKFTPTKEETELLNGFNGDKESLGECERYFLELVKVPRVESKLRSFSFKIQFRSQISELRKNLTIVNACAEEIMKSTKLNTVMRNILSLGKILNQGTARGSGIGFRLDSLLKLSDARASSNSKMTLMHYLCKDLARRLPEVLDFHKELASLDQAAKIQLKSLAEEMQALNKGLEMVEQELTKSENDGPVSDAFRKKLKEFVSVAEADIGSLNSLFSTVGRNADALAQYVLEDPARCSFEQVVSNLLSFVRMFLKAYDENRKQIDMEKRKAQKAAQENQKTSFSVPKKSKYISAAKTPSSRLH